jgi:nucleoside-diphosphate-sugar epimerase
VRHGDLLLHGQRGDLARSLLAAEPPSFDAGTVLVSVVTQPANSLLHDGHRWRRFPPARIRAAADEAVALARRRRATLLVHASFALLGSVDRGEQPGAVLLPYLEATLEAEAIVLGGGVPACVVRLGYLYGPDFRDLKVYRRAFRLGRPYWSGPARRVHHFLHVDDAVTALLSAAARAPVGRTVYATDDQPTSFRTFMDHFAKRAGNPLPLHLPELLRPLSQFVVAPEHMDMVKLGERFEARPRVPGWKPRYPDYRSGLATFFQG